MIYAILVKTACGTTIPDMARRARTLGASIDFLASLAEMAVLSVFYVLFTEFTDFSVLFTRAILLDSGILSKTGKPARKVIKTE